MVTGAEFDVATGAGLDVATAVDFRLTGGGLDVDTGTGADEGPPVSWCPSFTNSLKTR